ncbi:MAG: HD domain-containing protein [bacterium]
MLLNPKIQKAIYVATHQHRSQTRKVNNLPYIVHPFSVAWLLSEQTKDEDVIVAALLHDVLEDTEGYEYSDIVRDFGERVANIVSEVTEKSNLDWKDRKEKYINRLESASEEALMLATADKIHNLVSIREDILETGVGHWGIHFKSFEEVKWFYDSVFEVVEKRLTSKALLEEFRQELGLLKEN